MGFDYPLLKHLNMRSIIAIVLMGLLLGLGACKTRKIKTKGKEPQNAMSVVRETNYAKPEVSAAASFTIQEMSIEGDIATVVINYSGGCNEHKFSAHFNGMFMKSMPPKATVFIDHDNGGDNCRKLVVDTLYIDLKEVRYAKDKKGTVIVGFNGGDKTLEYKY